MTTGNLALPFTLDHLEALLKFIGAMCFILMGILVY